MKKALIVGGNLQEIVKQGWQDYEVKYQSFTQAEELMVQVEESFVPDLLVVDLCNLQEMSSALLRENLLHFLALWTKEMKTLDWSSLVLILPEQAEMNQNMEEAAFSYFMQGVIKSMACELGEWNMIVNAIVAHCPVDHGQVANMVRFFSNPLAYSNAQVVHIHPMETRSINYAPKENPTMLITGAGQGIGLATAKACERHHLLLNDLRYTEGMKQLVDAGQAEALIGDISDKTDFGQRLSQWLEEHDGIDVFVGNAAFMELQPFSEEQEALINKHYNINVQGHLDCLNLVIPKMKAQGGGTIILMSSMFGIQGWKNGTGYAATKTAMIGIVKSLHKQLKAWNIHVVGVAPGVIDTPQLQADADDLGIILEEMKEIYAQDTPLKRIGKPEDVGYMIRYLAEGGAKGMSGRIMQTNGGECRATCEEQKRGSER